jgi:hypothetical protein
MERCVMITVGALEQGGASIRTVIGDKLLLIVWANGEVGSCKRTSSAAASGS